MFSLFVLLPLYCLGIQYERGGWWRVFYVVAIPATLLDALLNYTELALLTWDRPERGEYMFTKRLNRLKHSPTWRGPVALYLCKVLDAIAPTGCHCK